MSSLKQIDANRRNALKSTGPISLHGKQRSRQNAWRHGLTAEAIIVKLDNVEDYRAFETEVISGYDIEMPVERELVLRLASVLWRLRRATRIESGLFDSVVQMSSTHELARSEKGFTDAFLRLAAVPTHPLDRLSRYEHILWRQARQIIVTLESLRRPKRHFRRSIFPFNVRCK